MQSELSDSPSNAQRDLPYSGLDVARGVEHLQMMGVRYYMAFSESALAQARGVPELVQVATSGPWTVFEVIGSEPVSGLSELPVVTAGLGSSGEDWMVPAVGSFLAGHAGPMLALDGPESWPRMDLADLEAPSVETPSVADRVSEMRRLSQLLPEQAPRVKVEPTQVSDIRRDNHSISFSVDRVGSPVLVRTSYFPNWSVSGADGPYRVTPNLMVVVPTSHDVDLSYGRHLVQWVAAAITLVGLAAAVWGLTRTRRRSEEAV